jgi:cob(I)alamin adenosyltransferase
MVRTMTSSTHHGRESDLGQTVFGDVGEVPKDDIRVEACAACEEANTAIGHALASGGYDPDVARTLTSLQNDLLDLAADLSVPTGERREADPVRIVGDHVAWVDRAVEHFREGLPEVDGFVLPGGTLAASLLYQARLAVRRAERIVVRARHQHAEEINPLTVGYLNSVSSLLFALARRHNVEHGDMTWRPLASVTPPEGAQAAG